jgi:hypothetical protein
MSRRRRNPAILLTLVLGLAAALPALAAGPQPQGHGSRAAAVGAPGFSWGSVLESLFLPFQAVAKALHLAGAASTTPSPPPPATDGGSELNPDGKG